MELKPGYTQTEVGTIPNDWGVSPASQVGQFRGGTGFPLAYQGLQEGAFPFYKVSDMNNGGNEKFMVAANNWVSEDVRRILGAHIFPAGSIVFAKVGAAVFLERKKILSRPSCLDNNMAAFVLDEKQACVPFVHAQLLDRKLGDLVATTALPSLSGKVLGQMVLVLPPLPEQSAIATALSDVDALLAAQDALIEKKRAIKQGAMQELLTGKRRLPGFGGEWEVKRLGDVMTIRHGRDQKSVTSVDGEFPILATGGRIGWSSRWLCNKPSVLIGRKGTIDRPQYMDTPFWTVDTLFYSELNQHNVAKFFYFRFFLIEWQRHNEASGVPSLNARTIENIELACPEPDEQAAISLLLSDMDAEISALQAQREKTAQLKQGMMQALLTGRIRLV